MRRWARGQYIDFPPKCETLPDGLSNGGKNLRKIPAHGPLNHDRCQGNVEVRAAHASRQGPEDLFGIGPEFQVAQCVAEFGPERGRCFVRGMGKALKEAGSCAQRLFAIAVSASGICFSTSLALRLRAIDTRIAGNRQPTRVPRSAATGTAQPGADARIAPNSG